MTPGILPARASSRNWMRETPNLRWKPRGRPLIEQRLRMRTADEFFAAQRKLQKLPRNSSAVRIRNRCSMSGRPRAYKRKYGVSRIQFRELALAGKIPGVIKSSW